MTDALGTKLKRAREASGLALRDIAVATKISVSALEALERNDFSRLPGGIFSRAFVRSYATAVGLDPEAAVEEFLAEITRSESEAARVATEHPEVTPEDRAFLDRQKRAIWLLQVAGVLAVIALGTGAAFAWMKWTRSSSATATPAPTTQPASPAPAPPPPASPPLQARPPATSTAPPPAAPNPKAAAGAPPVTVVPPEAPPPVPVTPQQQDPLTLEFEVTSPSFVEIAADGKVSFSKAMEPGDRQRIQALRELRIKVGDAGAFVWSLNGKPARMLGEAGIARSARITRSNFKRFLQ
ncbi:MAG TPA: RodZ domain-containing protein [Vicinamibacterales bacterium]|nr:RodZ domain-containing protein [Vicinamibacterales bacterium]